VWTAHADHGQIGQDTSKVELAGNVHVDGLLPGSPELADLATQKLRVDTQADILHTEEPVIVNWAGRQLKSRGIIAAMKERRLLLESSVHGTFLP
jgi:LPS export ABC transporter protein LptC